MPEGHVLEFAGVTKRFGAVAAVSDFSARVEPGVVTGFLGPNGAGKTTTLRILLGLVRATEGSATIGGRPYAKLADPLRTVGAVLEASSFHPGRTAAAHLRVYARAAGLPVARVDEVLALVGLADAAGRKVGGFSLGMRQRLGLAYALLGDPGVLVLDEPANGLDPEGIRWMRGFLRSQAREGRTVLVSSHLLTEIQQTVDALVIIAQGRLVFQGGIEELVDPSEYATIADAPDRAALTTALAAAEVPYEVLRSGITVRGLDPTSVGRVAADAGVALSTLQKRGPALEEVFLELVSGARVHPSATGGTLPMAPLALDSPAVVAAAAVVDGPAADDVPLVERRPEARDETAEPAVEGDAAAEGDDVSSRSARSTTGEGDGPEAGDETPEPAVESDPEADGDDVSSRSARSTTGEGDVPESGDETPEPAVESDPQAEGDDVSSRSARSTTGDGSEPERPAFAVASTGVIDIVPVGGFDPPEDADPDVEAIGEIDQELSDEGPASTPSDPDARPFDSYEKTDSDHDADAFFASYDDGEAPDDDTEHREEGDGR